MNYDFEDDLFSEIIDPEIEEEAVESKQLTLCSDISPNLRITACCGNCIFFTYYRNKLRRGYCRRANLSIVPTRLGSPNGTPNPEAYWPKRHITNVCDKHQMPKANGYNVFVTTYTKLNFDKAGMITDEDKHKNEFE